MLGEVGHREPDQIARWFGDRNAFPAHHSEDRRACRIRDGGPHRRIRRAARSLNTAWRSFSSLARSRRLGVGRTAVNLILNRFAGRWEITEYLRNPGAVSFWRRVVAGYTRGSYQERVINGEVRQVFDSRIERSR